MRTARQMTEGFFLALQFFTIIPIHREIPIDEKRIKFAVLSLPMIGFFIGLTGSLIMYMAKSWTPLSNWACALFLLFYFVAITGGIHLDGFTDTADAYFSFRDKEKG
nr:adenosylcobinamide-GDP ribazoletransferase [Aeribacillus pallidus]